MFDRINPSKLGIIVKPKRGRIWQFHHKHAAHKIAANNHDVFVGLSNIALIDYTNDFD